MRPTVAAALMSGGGLILLATLSLDYIPPAGFWIYIAAQGAGFAVIFVASLLSYGALPVWGWAALVAGSGFWLICWSWFLHLGMIIPIPLLFWATAGSVMLLASTFVAGAGSHPTAVLLPAPLAVGSIMSAGIMAMNPVFGVGYTYAPVGAGALLGGILHVVASSRIRARGTGGTLKSP